MKYITIAQNTALTELIKNGSLHLNQDGSAFQASKSSLKHSLADIQQLVSDGFASAADFVMGSAGFRIYTTIKLA